uniref:Uncharacterized protein n=1 Tax=Anguilla anguilla TaxID=7936 RepID=A0A0E9UYU4_ANGAN
MSVCESRA